MLFWGQPLMHFLKYLFSCQMCFGLQDTCIVILSYILFMMFCRNWCLTILCTGSGVIQYCCMWYDVIHSLFVCLVIYIVFLVCQQVRPICRYSCFLSRFDRFVLFLISPTARIIKYVYMKLLNPAIYDSFGMNSKSWSFPIPGIVHAFHLIALLL